MQLQQYYTDTRKECISHVLRKVYGDPKNVDKTDTDLLKLLDKIK